jgi:hypothetical protein
MNPPMDGVLNMSKLNLEQRKNNLEKSHNT